MATAPKTEDLEFPGLVDEAPSKLMGKQAWPAANFPELLQSIKDALDALDALDARVQPE